MAVSFNASLLFSSAEKEINNIVQTLIKDRRTDRSRRENTQHSIDIIQNTLSTFRDEIMRLQNMTEDLTYKSASFADVVQSSTTEPKVRRTKPVVIVSPKNAEEVKDSEQTLKLIQATTKAKSLHFGVNYIKKVRNKSVLLELRDENECKTFVNHIQSSNVDLLAKVPIKKNPRIIIHGIENSLAEEELVDSILQQNPVINQAMLEENESIKLCIFKVSRNGHSKYAVIEVTPKVYKAFVICKKLYIGYIRCNFNDYIPVIRCYNCSGFGHVAADCNSQLACSNCSESHEQINCPKLKVECVNCTKHNQKMSSRHNYKSVDANHSSTSLHCSLYKKIVEIIKSKINYG